MTGPLICRRTANVADMHAGGEWCACELERGQCHFSGRYIRIRDVVENLPPRRHRLEPGQCVSCDRDREEGPSHDPSQACESGKHPHCTCDVCF